MLVIYISTLLILCFLGPKTDILSKTISVTALIILAGTVLYSNFVFCKKPKQCKQIDPGSLE